MPVRVLAGGHEPTFVIPNINVLAGGANHVVRRRVGTGRFA
jgi:hypothetical protein